MDTPDTRKKLGASILGKSKKGDTGIEMKSNNPGEEEQVKVPIKKEKKVKSVNRKNVADGRLKLIINETDRVPEGFEVDYRDNPRDVFDQAVSRTTSYVESNEL